MIVKESLLKFENFAVLNSVCRYNHGEDLSRELLYSYPVNVDFDILEHKEEYKFKVVVSVRLNNENKPGYTIQIDSVTFFGIAGEASAEDVSVLIQHSGVQMAVANLRAYIEAITSYYPLGKYTLPTIDLNDLLHQKAQTIVDRNSNNS